MGRSREHQNGSSYGTVYGDSVTVTGPQVQLSNGVIRLTVAYAIMYANSSSAAPISPISLHTFECPPCRSSTRTYRLSIPGPYLICGDQVLC
ncbi:uncharacterized protein ARMOST_01566 [Armillaria ostoyae]|uniref:Uncharacterized protein n=1 Tax=Armillaria ostoyae TaxID=47428 RepID=A0A284QPC2_ARMOS|nr:uncharacterized protein ARMOST_01566 [Armillaria ostoyae]